MRLPWLRPFGGMELRAIPRATPPPLGIGVSSFKRRNPQTSRPATPPRARRSRTGTWHEHDDEDVLSSTRNEDDDANRVAWIGGPPNGMLRTFPAVLAGECLVTRGFA